MIDKRIYFLAGLPRTGSTLLGSILAQNPEVHVTPTSPLYSLLVNVNQCFNQLSLQFTYDHDAVSSRVYHAIIKAFYADVKEPVIFDKFRGWPKHVPAIAEYLNWEPRIICTVRPIAEIITSYIVLADKDPDNFIDKHLRTINEPVNNEARANLLWSYYMKSSYDTMQQGMETHRANLLLIQYRDLVSRTQATLEKIYNFCDLDMFNHSMMGIENRCAEAKDEGWGMLNLHTIRPQIGLQSSNPAAYLSKEAIGYLSQFDL